MGRGVKAVLCLASCTRREDAVSLRYGRRWYLVLAGHRGDPRCPVHNARPGKSA